MGAPAKIHVLQEFDPFLRALQAYNAENFGHIVRRHNVENWCFATGILTGTALSASMITLAIWHLFDCYGDWNKFVISGPIVLTLIQMLTSCVALTMANRKIDGTIGQLQLVIDKRKSIDGG